MKSSVLKRSIIIVGHKTSVSLEDEFWKGLREIAHKASSADLHYVGNGPQARWMAGRASIASCQRFRLR
jgi:Ribbon-helix-helix domain